jgi:GH18 family chitinase
VCSYENSKSIAWKALDILLKGFRGAFAWDFASDGPDHELLEVLSRSLLPLDMSSSRAFLAKDESNDNQSKNMSRKEDM